MARDVLENPPPLTPDNQRDFPYLARAFPFRDLADGAGIVSLTAPPAGIPHNSASDPVE